jgi:hypothetical protein
MSIWPGKTIVKILNNQDHDAIFFYKRAKGSGIRVIFGLCKTIQVKLRYCLITTNIIVKKTNQRLNGYWDT